MSSISSHSHIAGRGVAGEGKPVTISKDGNRHVRREPNGETRNVLSIGLACSECLSGPQLAKVLQRGFEYEQQVMKDLMAGVPAAPLSIHTSAGIPEATDEFIEELAQHLPWKESDSLDWCVSLQLEGASAVWAAIDMLLQEQMLTSGNENRKMVAVGNTSYHGPPATSFGSGSPMWEKNNQIKYPTPVAGQDVDEEELITKFKEFLDKHGDEVGVILVEPQWGSTQAAYPWPKELLKTYVKMSQERGIKVCADEIMCGLGRHGLGTLFISTAYDLDPDAITFGKAVAAGAYPLSGAIMKRGCSTLAKHGRSVLQSHTFAGSHQRALMAATDLLRELPTWLPSITKLGEEMCHIFSYLEKLSKGMLVGHGQGLMWGCLFTKEGQNADESYRSATAQCFKKHCENIGVVPYFVPAGGFMVTPVVDIDVGTIYEIGEKLAEAVERTMLERQWNVHVPRSKSTLEMQENLLTLKELAAKDAEVCLPALHTTKTCTTCSSFVSHDRRHRFVLAQ